MAPPNTIFFCMTCAINNGSVRCLESGSTVDFLFSFSFFATNRSEIVMYKHLQASAGSTMFLRLMQQSNTLIMCRHTRCRFFSSGSTLACLFVTLQSRHLVLFATFVKHLVQIRVDLHYLTVSVRDNVPAISLYLYCIAHTIVRWDKN